ncbi:Protein GrpE [Syntrophobacter sp. SbD2]|nr:Protein GrpE [Syntrophobacter sp. SbD2]
MKSAERKPDGKNPCPGDQVETQVDASHNNEQEDCRQILSRREEELKEAQDRILRLAAELDNTRKRLEREKSEGIVYANESIMRQLIDVVDNLERAIEHGERDLDGVRMTLKSFLDVFARFGAAPFESVGCSFDPNLHEAVIQERNPDYPDMTVTKEFQKGYTLRDRLLRPARVGVSRNAKDDTC